MEMPLVSLRAAEWVYVSEQGSQESRWNWERRNEQCSSDALDIGEVWLGVSTL